MTGLLHALILLAPAQDLESAALSILHKQCLNCHGSQTRMGGLVLETRAGALKGGTKGPAIVPGNSAASPLAKRVLEGTMPVGNPLPSSDRQLLARWIDTGAPWSGAIAAVERKRAGKDWWSLQPLGPVEAGATIDQYLRRALSAKGLKMSVEADRRTLIRRATFDLLGLPPSPMEVAAFAADTRPDAYERLIDRLLMSPAYGERWGRHWMDVIRFGESHGYEQNHLRPNAWPFRDYIIRSFNRDKPFDRVLQEHLAGDVLADGDPWVSVGTGFLVAGPHDTVGNQNEMARRQQRADDLDDMINATASAFLGLTVNCAKCHDHKFDPIAQTDYYRMQAVFAGVIHGEREVATEQERRAYEQQAGPVERDLAAVGKELNAIREEAAGAVKAQREAILARYRPAPDAQLTEEAFPAQKARLVRLAIDATSTGGPAALEEIEVWSGQTNVALASAGAKVRASSVRRADDDAEAYSDQHLIDGRFDRRWFPADGKPVTITVELPAEVAVQRVSWSRDRAGGFQGRFGGPIPNVYRVEVSGDGTVWKQVASSKGRLPVAEAQRERLLLMAVLPGEKARQFEAAEAREKSLQKQLAAIEKPPAGYVGRFEQPKEPAYLLKRGSVMDRGEPVPAGSLSALPGFELDLNAPESERRLALARWITDARNPLTPRVLANRVWHYHFGRGIVGTPSDFGFNGERPTHPELLDYLASRLIAYGWRLKPLHKEIMMSAAYRQSGSYDESSAKVDSEARLLWRFPPRRLEAEAIRDSILTVSGKLNRTMGGPGFRLFRYTVDNVATYYPLEEFGEDTWRRAVYQQAARSVRSEMLGQYDCPDSSLPEPKRVVTTSPLQALALLNNSFLIGQAKHFAGRLLRESPDDPVGLAFQLAYGREPEAGERAAAKTLIAKHGLAAFCRALLNSNEFVYVM
ncbi:MAG: DUF1553 domain-containing protein [Bryobacteraceae bacterium]|nr:DUF1553 domain-containing protein [Bryobacteraceae bacterium]